MNLITVQTFQNSIEAHLLKSKLESEGITCFLFDENMVGLNPLYNVTIGGIKLKIDEKDAEKVRVILSELENTALTDDHGAVITCPDCKSDKLISGFKSMKGFNGILSAITSFLFMIFPIYYNNVYRCKECGKEFKKE